MKRCLSLRLISLFIVVLGLSLALDRLKQPSVYATSINTASNISYGGQGSQNLDIYSPSDSSTHPIVIMVHGGGWYQGDKRQVSSEAQSLASSGFIVFNINYRLATSTTAGYPMEVDDVKQAVNWVADHAALYHGDAQNINLIGGSAGANLVDLVGEQLNTNKPNTIKRVVSLSAPTDLVRLINQQGGDPKPPDIHYYLGCSKDCSSSPLANQASPDMHADNNCPAFLILNSDNELVPVDQAKRLNDALVSANCTVTMQILSGTNHAFAYYSQVSETIIKFLNSSQKTNNSNNPNLSSSSTNPISSNSNSSYPPTDNGLTNPQSSSGTLQHPASGTVTLTSPYDLNIASVQYQIDGKTIARSSQSPFTANLNTNILANGWHELVTVVNDKDGSTYKITKKIFVKNPNPWYKRMLILSFGVAGLIVGVCIFWMINQHRKLRADKRTTLIADNLKPTDLDKLAPQASPSSTDRKPVSTQNINDKKIN